MQTTREEAQQSFQRIPGIHIASSILVDHLKNGTPGDVLTDEELTKLCGRDTRPGGNGYGYLATAIKICLRDHRIVWKRTRGAWCIKCLVPEEVLLVVRDDSERIHRTAKKSMDKIKTVSIESVPEKQRPEYMARMAQFGTIALFAKRETSKKLAARNISRPFDVQRMLEAMK